MVKRLLLSLSLLVTVACGKFQTPGPAYIDPNLLPYVMDYQVNKKLYIGVSTIRKIDIVFGSLSQNGWDGVCYYRGPYRKIVMDAGYWYDSSTTEDDRLVLMHHELGHCDLNLDHTDDQTIMNPYAIPGSVYRIKPSYYLDMLFRKGQ